MMLYALIAWLGAAALAEGKRYAVASYRTVGDGQGLSARWLDHHFMSEM